MSLTLIEEVRLLLGEPIPDGGDETDTMFTDTEVLHFVGKATGSDHIPEQAAYHGWLAKMAQFANLVTVNEGNASREATELHRNAQRMVTRFEPYVSGSPGNEVAASKGRARIGQMVRPGGRRGPFGADARRR